MSINSTNRYKVNKPTPSLFIFFLSINGCGNNNLCVEQEVVRKKLQDSIVEAVVVKTNCGATTSNSFKVFLTSKGQNTSKESVFLADRVDNLNISWLSEKQLLITYDKARIFQFRNFWQPTEIDDFHYTISILERPN